MQMIRLTLSYTRAKTYSPVLPSHRPEAIGFDGCRFSLANHKDVTDRPKQLAFCDRIFR